MGRNRAESGGSGRNEWRPRNETDPYKILGVSKDATLDEIKRAFRARAMQYHPDVNEDGEDDFKKIAHAYELLRDTQKRGEYDASGADKEEYYKEDLEGFEEWEVWQLYVLPDEPLGSQFNPDTVFVKDDATEVRCPYCGSRVLIGHAKGLFDCGRNHVLNIKREKGSAPRQIAETRKRLTHE